VLETKLVLEPTPTLPKPEINRRVLLLIALCALIAVIPMLLSGYREDSHDLDAHITSWMEASQQFRQLILFPRWAAAANYGFGEPRFIFYPPLSWIIGGFLGLFLPWVLVPPIYVWLALTIAGASMWKCAREWLPPPQAAMAAILFAFNPYAITTTYIRCAYPELLASAFFPILAWAALRIGTSGRRGIATLAVALAAIWLTNYPAGVIATYSLMILLLLQWLVLRSMRTALWGAAATLLGLALDAFILLPATWETKWIAINAVLIPRYLPWRNFVLARGMTLFGKKASMIAVVFIGAAALAIWLSRKLRERHFLAWSSFTTLAAFSTFMLFSPSVLLWRHLPALRFVQFPWRWLFPLAFAVSLLTAAALTQVRRTWLAWLVIACVLLTIDARAVLTALLWSTAPITDHEAAINSGRGYEGLAEYAPLATQPAKLWKDAPWVLVVGEQIGDAPKLQVKKWSPVQKLIAVESPRPIDLDLKLLAYPSWRAKSNGQDLETGTNPDTGQIRLHLPAGSNRIEVSWRRTWDVIAGNVLTLLACMITIVLFRGKSQSSDNQTTPDRARG
jgi:hypothetical protein